MNNKLKWVGLAGIPLAIVGTLAASVAFAAQPPVAEQPASVQTTVAPTTQADTDTETNDDGAVSSSTSGAKADTDTETNDDASGPQEAPGTEQAD
jgi:hypothetical protein